MTRASLALALVVVVGCKSSAHEKAEDVVKGDAFWPEAPKPTSTSGTRTLAYKPENITAYVLTAAGGTPARSEAKLDFAMTLALRFAAGATPRERDARMDRLELTVGGAGMTMKMKLDHDEMMVEQGGQPAMHMKRGEPGALDVAAMTDRPFTTLVFGDDNTVTVRAIPDHPWSQLGAGDMLDDTLVLFPDLPKQAIAPGYKWSMSRNTALGGTGTRIDVKYDFEYVGDGPCPSGAKSCAQLRLSAATKEKEIHEQGIDGKVTLAFAGKVFFNLDTGAIDESRERMDLELVAKSVDLTINGTFALVPVK